MKPYQSWNCSNMFWKENENHPALFAENVDKLSKDWNQFSHNFCFYFWIQTMLVMIWHDLQLANQIKLVILLCFVKLKIGQFSVLFFQSFCTLFMNKKQSTMLSLILTNVTIINFDLQPTKHYLELLKMCANLCKLCSRFAVAFAALLTRLILLFCCTFSQLKITSKRRRQEMQYKSFIKFLLAAAFWQKRREMAFSLHWKRLLSVIYSWCKKA